VRSQPVKAPSQTGKPAQAKAADEQQWDQGDADEEVREPKAGKECQWARGLLGRNNYEDKVGRGAEASEEC